MSDRASGGGEAKADAFFRLGPTRPLATILLILAFLALCGLAFGALLGTDIDVEPFVPEQGPDPAAGNALGPVGLSAPAGGALALPQILTSPSPTPPSPTVGASPIGDQTDQPGGEPERFGPNGEGVLLVPDGWTVLTRTHDLIALANGNGVRFTARIIAATASTPATQLVTEERASILSSNVAAHVRSGTVLELQPYGSLVTRSTMGYSALRVDAQGVASVAGNIFAFVRGDGVALIVNPEVTPAAQWESMIPDWLPLWESVTANFAAPLPA